MSEPGASTSTVIPLMPLLLGLVPGRVRQASVKLVNLYYVLAHALRLLKAWIDFT